MTKARLSNRGYTLIEVLFTLFLVMILVYQVIPRFSSSQESTRLKIDSMNRLRIEGAVELYKLDTGKMPGTIDDLILPPQGAIGWRGPYLERIPANPIKGSNSYELDEKGKVRIK
jgi:general secretion pathway protein G